MIIRGLWFRCAAFAFLIPITTMAIARAQSPVASLTSSLAFPNTSTGSTSAAMVATLSNTGNAPLSSIAATIVGANAGDFAISTGANACGVTLAASSTCSIYVTFAPASAASLSASLSVADNASGSPQTAALTGTGTGAAAKTPTPTTNVGSASNSNVQNLDLSLRNITMNMFTPTSKINKSAGTLSITSAKDVVLAACPGAVNAKTSRLDHGTYVLFNVIRLSNPDAKKQQAVASNNWYVFAEETGWSRGWPRGWTVSDFDGSTRLYGAKTIWQVSIVLNEQGRDNAHVGYAYTVTKATPSNIANVEALLGVVLPASGGNKAAAPPNTDPDSYWACSSFPVAYSDSSIKVDTTYPVGETSPFSSTVTLTSESKQYWDVSFALPVKKASALQYSSTSNTITPTQINKQSLFATVDLYFPPTNLSRTGYSLVPHPFAGVAMSQQPLHSLLFGGAVGLNLAQVYAGVLLLKQQQLTGGLSSGGTATPTQLAAGTSYGFKPGFSVGVKISIMTGVKSLTKSK